MKRFATILLLIAAFPFTTVLRAQSTISVTAPNLVALDEQFNLTFVIEGSNAPSEFNWSPGDDFQLVWGPQKGTSTSVSIINGKTTKSSQTTYTYVLMPKRTGTFQIQSATAKVKGDDIVSRRATIQVVSNQSSSQSSQSSSTQPQQQQQQNSAAAAETGTVSGEDLFMRLSLSKTKAVVGETITATLKLYQRVNIAGFEDAKFPGFTGFWSQEVQAPSNIEFHRESIGDMIYNAAVLRSWTLIPQQAGDIKIDPAELVCLVNVRTSRSSSNSIFDAFFQDDYRTIRKRVTTPAYTVHVSKVPAGAPASFGGGVGTFKMSASVSKDSLRTHDAASLKVVVTGKGNISLLEAPKIDFPPDFEVYDVKVSESSESKTFEYPFIPRSHGDFVLGPVEYSYYDVSAGKYVTLSSVAMPVMVSRGNESEGAAVSGGQLVSPSARKDVKDLGSDIRYISTKVPQLRGQGRFFVGSGLFWTLLALLLASAVVVFCALRGMAKRRADVAGSRSRGATKMARKRLSQAGEFLSKDLYTAFYEELHKALLGFVSDKFTMNASDMSKENILARMKESGVDETSANGFIDLIDACEYARYAPSEGHKAMNDHYESAVNVISSIDDRMGKTSKSGRGARAALLALIISVSIPSTMDAKGRADSGSRADSLWQAGVEAYAASRWEEASGNWSAIADLGLESPDLYYNIGNSFFKAGDTARAILYYERALKLDPSHSDAAYNLDFANSMVQDKIESVPEFFLKTWLSRLGRSVGSNLWAVFFLIFFAGFLAMALVFLLARASGARKAGFFTGIALLVLSAASISFAFSQRARAESVDSAIIMTPVVPVKSSPDGDSSKDLFVLHEGTKATVLDTVGAWSNIELSDGRQGWVRSRDIEII